MERFLVLWASILQLSRFFRHLRPIIPLSLQVPVKHVNNYEILQVHVATIIEDRNASHCVMGMHQSCPSNDRDQFYCGGSQCSLDCALIISPGMLVFDARVARKSTYLLFARGVCLNRVTSKNLIRL